MVISARNTKKRIIYPISDGKPMADGDRQWRCIVYIKNGFDALYEDEDVYITGDTFWYPVQGDTGIVQAPDTLIAIGRPKGDRNCYFQWKEGNVAPQIIFEIWSRSNNQAEMDEKRAWYEQYGVQEYYEFDPKRLRLMGWYRKDGKFEKVEQMQGWVSPLTKVSFKLVPEDKDNELKLFEPNGKPFLTYLELQQKKLEAEQAQLRAQQAQEQEREARRDAEKARSVAEQARLDAEKARLIAEQSTEQEKQARLIAEQSTEQEKQARLIAEQSTEQEKQARLDAEQKLQDLIAKLKAQGIEVPE
jgi:flagellar biosynthesis GTPase FlhF